MRSLTDYQLPESPTASRFGWPSPARVEEFGRLLSAAGLPTYRMGFQGKIQDFAIIRIPSNLPKYRLANGRTVSLQEEYMARHSDARSDLFNGDPELLDAQEVQHTLLLSLADQADLYNFFKDTSNRQVEPIVLDEYGFVVNGNRRLAVWRELFSQDSHKYGHFGHIDVVVLPHCDEREIDRLEAFLQIQRDIKAEYSWDSKANMMLQKQKRDGFSDKELAALYHMKESEVRELLEMREHAADYLRTRGKGSHWSLVSDAEYAFKKLVSVRSKITNLGEREVFTQAAYALIDRPEEVGIRLYEAIPGIQENIGHVKARLQEQFPVQKPAQNEDWSDILGGQAVSSNGGTNVSLAAEIARPENTAEVRNIVVDVIETQRQIKRESKAERLLVDNLAKAQAVLAIAIRNGLRPEAKTEGVQQQLNAIRSQIQQVEKWLKDHASNII